MVLPKYIYLIYFLKVIRLPNKANQIQKAALST